MVRTICLLALALAGACRSATAPATLPTDAVARLHGHNDYLQPVPLHTALQLGLGSVEADVFLVDGELLVGHERWQLRAAHTLRAMYLEPLRALATANGGRVRTDGRPFVLLVDIKTDGEAVYQRLREELSVYRDLLTHVANGRTEPGAVTVILSGDRPRATVAADRDRLCALDGRLGDLTAEPSPPADLVPWISDAWEHVSDWDGKDELTAAERQRLRELVASTRAQGRELRFWGAPDRPEAWAALIELGVDHIGTDQPKAAVHWFRQQVAR